VSGGRAPLWQLDEAPFVVVVPGQMASTVVYEHVGQFIVKQPTVAVVQLALLLTYIPGGARLWTYARISLPAAGQCVM
jgi:hypothetical protein